MALQFEPIVMFSFGPHKGCELHINLGTQMYGLHLVSLKESTHAVGVKTGFQECSYICMEKVIKIVILLSCCVLFLKPNNKMTSIAKLLTCPMFADLPPALFA